MSTKWKGLCPLIIKALDLGASDNNIDVFLAADKDEHDTKSSKEYLEQYIGVIESPEADDLPAVEGNYFGGGQIKGRSRRRKRSRCKSRKSPKKTKRKRR